MLKEVAGKLDWVTVIAAFVGMLLVVKPTMSMETVPALIGALGGFGAVLRIRLSESLDNAEKIV